MKKTIIALSTGILAMTIVLLNNSVVKAQINPQSISNSIGTSLKNAVNATKKNAEKNSDLRNQLVTANSADLKNKEKDLADELTLSLLSLENIQSRIAAKTADLEASGTDVDSINTWLASSSQKITVSQNDISLFASSTFAASTSSVEITRARRLADTSINAVNSVRDDLQSALNELTATL